MKQHGVIRFVFKGDLLILAWREIRGGGEYIL